MFGVSVFQSTGTALVKALANTSQTVSCHIWLDIFLQCMQEPLHSKCDIPISKVSFLCAEQQVGSGDTLILQRWH